MAEAAEEFPAIHGFPPFFTRQPHAATWERQCALWCDVVVLHCRASKRFVLPLADELGAPQAAVEAYPRAVCAPFSNARLSRSLPMDVRRAVIDALVERGDAAWLGAERTAALVFWRPVAELAQALVDHVRAEHFSATGSAILTYYELFEDEATAGMPFHGLPAEMAVHLLQWMAARGTVVLMGPLSSGVHELGLKFRL